MIFNAAPGRLTGDAPGSRQQPFSPRHFHWSRRASFAGSQRVNALGLVFSLVLLLAWPARAAEQYGDISVSPNAMYTGSTYHGYAETRVVLENRSSAKTHSVKLVYPNDSSGGYGNYIGQITRTVTLPPNAREVISLLQPPLPTPGDNVIRVTVDGRHEGEVRAPNANNHCNYYGRGSGQMATVLISRNLDFDAVTHVFQAGSIAYTAAKATGSPDVSGHGYQPNCWMPDNRMTGRTNWLELDYPPQPASQITIHSSQPLPGTCELVLIAASGTNLMRIPAATGHSSSPGGGDWETTYECKLTAEPVKTVRLNFDLAPPRTISIDAVEISSPSASAWAVDARASSDNSASAPRYTPGSSGVDEVFGLRAESPVAEWSENWLAYSPFDAVIVNAADVSAMTPAVFTALGDYVLAGGNIVLLGQGSLPAAWRPTSAKNWSDGKEFDVGFGSAFAFGSENAATISPKSVQRLREVVRDRMRYFQNLPADSGTANELMPVVATLKIPTRSIIIIMLAFIIVIGPVNLIYLNRINRRTWMLWTIPAISLVTTLLVFVYSLLREGITPDTRIGGVTVLDQTSHRAATIGGEAFYCPLTPSSGLYFDTVTEVTPLVSMDYGFGTARELDETGLQHFQRGWVSARVPAHFHLRKSETRRERIQVVNENGKLQVVNSLGAPIKSLWFADSAMHYYAASNIAAGEKAGLVPMNISVSEQSGVKGLFRDLGFLTPPAQVSSLSGKYLTPDTYIAVLDGNPFVENALGSAASAKRTKSSAVVFGLMETEDKAGGAK